MVAGVKGGRELVVEGHKKAVKASASAASENVKDVSVFCYLFLLLQWSDNVPVETFSAEKS